MSDAVLNFPMKAHQIHIWLFDLENQVLDNLFSEQILSRDEKARSQRYKFPRDRIRFIARRGILRQLISKYTGMDPTEIRYLTNQYGKLSLPLNPLFFNLSCCQNQIVFAFTKESEIGIDIEKVYPIPELPNMMELYFSPKERAKLSLLAPATQLKAFYHVWTQKEAFIKAQGLGFDLSMKEFSVSSTQTQLGKFYSIRGDKKIFSRWKTISFIPQDDWRVAVCVQVNASLEVLWFNNDISDFVPKFT